MQYLRETLWVLGAIVFAVSCSAQSIEVTPALAPVYLTVDNANLYIDIVNREDYLTGYAITAGTEGQMTDPAQTTNSLNFVIPYTNGSVVNDLYTLAYASPTVSQRIVVPFSDYGALFPGQFVVVYAYASSYALYSPPSNMVLLP